MTTSRVTSIFAITALAVLLAMYGPPPKSAAPGNVLHLASQSPPDYLDPGMSYMVVGWQTMVNVYNGLLTYKKEPGAAGAELVPDLAVAMPTVTDSGRTYTFTMRSGIKWGPPLKRDVLPSDLKYALERDLRIPSQGSSFYLNIVGAEDVQAKKTKLISGIVVNDTTRTITFHLIRPDATFLNALALPFAFAVPKGTPLTDQSFKGFVPATGPYMLTEFDPQRRIVLRRNPNFRSWSEHVPRGHVDGIQIDLGVNPENAITLIKRGKLDYIVGAQSVPRSKLPALLADESVKSQMHVETMPTTSYIFMNSKYPPFNERSARQAINWAIDRKAMVKLSGGLGVASETILPPNIPGYKDHNFYPGPDLDKARELLSSTGYKPGKIDIWCRTNPPNPDLAVYLQGVLTDLGFTPTVKCVDSSSFFTLVGNSKTKALIGFGNWSQDFPEGGNFIDVLLNGKYIEPSHSNNLSFYSGADDEIAKANQLLDMDARARAWGHLDAQIMRDAAWAPIFHGVSYIFVSERLQNYEESVSPVYDMLYSKVSLAGEKEHAANPGDAAVIEERAAAAGGGGTVVWSDHEHHVERTLPRPAPFIHSRPDAP